MFVFSLRSMRSFAANSSSLAAGRVASWRLCDFALKRFCLSVRPLESMVQSLWLRLRYASSSAPLRAPFPWDGPDCGWPLCSLCFLLFKNSPSHPRPIPDAVFLGVLCAPACIICGQKYAQVANTTELTYGIIYLRFSVDNSSLSSILDGLW